MRLVNFGSLAFFAFASRVEKMQMCQNLGGNALAFLSVYFKYKCRFGTSLKIGANGPHVCAGCDTEALNCKPITNL